MKSLDRGIWRSSISLVTKFRLYMYNVYILPVLLYGSDTMECDGSVETTSWCFWPMVLTPYSSRPIYCTLLTYQYGHKPTSQPPVSSLIQQCRLKLFGHIARAAASCRGPLTYATRIHRSPPCWLAPSKRSISSALASKNRERSKTAQPWTTLCIATSDGSFFLAMHRGNGYAVRDCHLMMMMIMMSCHVVGAIEIQLMLIVDRLICWLIVPLTFPLSRSSLSRSFFLLMSASHKLRSVWCQKNPQWVKPYSWLLNDDRHSSSLSANASLCKLYIAPLLYDYCIRSALQTTLHRSTAYKYHL